MNIDSVKFSGNINIHKNNKGVSSQNSAFPEHKNINLKNIPYYKPIFTGKSHTPDINWDTFSTSFTPENVQELINNGKNSKLAAMVPEFLTAYDYRMSFNHEFNVGKHTCEVFRHIIEDEEFKGLPKSEQNILLITTFFHDVGKTENVITKADLDREDFDEYLIKKLNESGIPNSPESYLENLIKPHLKTHDDYVLHNNIHATTSSLIARQVLTRMNAPEETIDRICLLVKHHSILGEKIHKVKYRNLMTEEEYKKSPKDVAREVMTPENLKLLKIFVLADEKSSNSKGQTNPNFPEYLDELYIKALDLFNQG